VSLSNCDHCWETPCVCDDAFGYKHLSINELKSIRGGIDKLIADKTAREVPPDKREHCP
jgi:hypothetical protein